MGMAACKTCGKEFERGRGQRYCEDHRVSERLRKAREQQARTALRRQMPILSCRSCGLSFTAKRSDAKYCEVCRSLQHERYAQTSEERKRHPCPGCGVTIARTSVQCRTCSQSGRIQKITGENNYAWKGGRHVDRHGYIHILIGPNQYRPEHQLVWEKVNGKPLPEGWIVHHINGIKDDNRLENLRAMPRAAHNDLDRRIEHLEAEVKRLRELKDKWKS